jgi:squalene-associated FAD-dependent desaturase
MESDDVIVVGGGLAGVSSALALADAGKQVTLIEARRFLGGRVASVEHPRLHFQMDNCQHAAFRIYSRFFQFLLRCNASRSMKMQRKTVLPFFDPKTQQFASIQSGKLSPPNHMVGSMLKFPFLGLKDKLAMRKVVKKLDKMTEQDVWGLDEVSFYDWLIEHGQTQDAIEKFWGFFILAALNIDVKEASAAQGCMLYKTGIFGSNEAFDVACFQHHLSHIFQNEILAALKDAGVNVHLSSSVNSIEVDTLGECTVSTNAKVFHSKQTVLATPPHITRKLLESSGSILSTSKDKLEIFERIQYTALMGIHAFYRGEKTPKTFSFAAVLGEPLIQMVFNRNHELQEPVAPGIQWLSVPVSHADALLKMDDEDILLELQRVLSRMFPETKDNLPVETLIVRMPKATFAARPGTYDSRPLPDHIHPSIALAGCYTATKWPSTMEGAIRSGCAAAAHILGINWNPDSNWNGWPEPPTRKDDYIGEWRM